MRADFRNVDLSTYDESLEGVFRTLVGLSSLALQSHRWFGRNNLRFFPVQNAECRAKDICELVTKALPSR